MSAQAATTTIVFADICRSTQLFELYGDARAREIEAETLSLLIEKAEKYEGEIVKTIGDEVMCRFSKPEKAVFSACEMQRAVTRSPSLSPLNLAIRVGLHCGEVILEDNDVFGDAVNTAARMAGLAKAQQIITTQSTVDSLPAIMRHTVRNLGAIPVRGKKSPLVVCEVIWQEDTSDLTTQFETIKERTGRPPRLSLTYNDRQLEITVENQPFSLGRNPKSHLIVETRFVSRNHASIEYRQGKFVLTDSSTNGTYIYMNDGRKVFVHRESFPLYGEGKISLGHDSSESETIYFTFPE
ncbi:MAG: adenylate/guanylate cyclase domain-containing protein [Gammaproteobacteria bacterium]|nr:adenylate/guanylate cyclase domain-containing protein [Gammaproteobacteria bacterium]MCP5424718.1 adenylate/guanylate cyclase domain-containing protein [Gammaproteobacteria bacterium]MCP5459247.1 adenylate/guanylate cyclase domain-containing protein [Gammaproteobacteria bacterium]